MFTGLIEHVGRVAALAPIEGGFRLSIETELGGALRPGDSVAVNGVCLTVVANETSRFETEIGPETARVTTLGRCAPTGTWAGTSSWDTSTRRVS